MPRSSVFITITFIFALALVSIFLAFLWLMGYDKQNYTRELNTKYSNVARTNLFYMGGIIDKDEYDRQLKNIDMPEISNEAKKDEILAKASVIEEVSDDIGSSAILLYNKHHYLKIQHLDEIKLLMDKEFQPYRYEVIKAVFIVVAIILLGAYIFVIYKIKPLRRLKRQIDKFANGELDAVRNVSRGNDEISEVSQAFYDAVSQIKALNDSRHLFLRNIMHELKTPLGVAGINLEMLGLENKYTNRIKNALKQMQITYEDVEYFIKRGYIKFPKERLDLGMYALERVRFLRSVAGAKHIKLITDIKDGVFVLISKLAAQRIIDNTITNAIKYSPQDTQIFINLAQNGDTAVLSVQDFGEGIKDTKRIWKRYEREDEVQGGFGLGLNIVSEICKKNDIAYDVKSVPGEGSTFFYTFKILKDVS